MNQPEHWLRGPVDGVPSLLQPVAHALLQAVDEIHDTLGDFPEHLLWNRPGGLASVGFHLQHIAGVLDRLFTYAEGEALSQAQLEYLSQEGVANNKINLSFLLENLDNAALRSIGRLKSVNQQNLTDVRYVGRKKIPSTTIGLLFHAAEHTMRHTGQLIVTARLLKQSIM